jgi:lipid II:glycine glycyltransferase (peptidoglycan interpeptide bridge formation enzyme)
VHYSDRYISFLTKALPGTDVKTLTVSEKDEITGIFPFATHYDKKFGFAINSLPFFGSHGGPVFKDRKSLAVLIEKFNSEISKIKPCSMTIVESPFQPLDEITISALGLETIDYRIGQFTPLPASISDFHVKTRNAIRKGNKLNLSIEKREDDESWQWMQSVHDKSIKSLNGVSKSMEIYNALRQSFSQEVELWVGRLDGKPISGVVIIKYQNTVEYFTPVIEHNYRDSQALSALIYRIMEIAGESGAKLWNWGGTWQSQKGVYRFKNRWGAFDKTYRYFNKVSSKMLFKSPKNQLSKAFPFFYLFKY